MDDNAYNPAGSGLAFMVGLLLSSRIVIPVLWVRVLDAEPQTGAAIKLALSFLLFAFAGVAWLDTAHRAVGSMFRISSIRWVFVFLAFSGCSLLWSETASPLASAVYWCGTAADAATVALLLLRGSAREAAASLMKGLVWGACLVAAIAWLMPAQYDLRLGDEDFLNPNVIGGLCALAIFFTQYLTNRKQGKWWPVTAFLAVTVLRSLSKSAIAAFVVSQSFLLIHDKQMSRRAKLLLSLSVVLVVLAFWGLLEAYYDFYTSYGNQAETLTGRTAIWAFVVDAGFERLWIGHGFDSMWNVVPTFGTFEARHAENEVLEQFYSYGIAGIVILCGVYASLYRRIRSFGQASQRVIFASILVFVVVRGIVEADPFDLLLPVWAIILLSVLTEPAGAAQIAGPIGQTSQQGQLPLQLGSGKTDASGAFQISAVGDSR